MASDTKSEGLSPWAAAAAVAGAIGFSAWLGTRHRPEPVTDADTFRWYRGLEKPSFTPPDPVFGIVWPILQTGLAWGGYRLFRKPSEPKRDVAAGLWLFNIAMIGGWSELFFGGRKLAPAAGAAAGMLASGAAFTAAAAQVDKKAAATGLPYVAWLGFATVLAEEIWRRNSGRTDIET